MKQTRDRSPKELGEQKRCRILPLGQMLARQLEKLKDTLESKES